MLAPPPTEPRVSDSIRARPSLSSYTAAVARVYDTSNYRKHKRPGGWGALCPIELDSTAAQELLQSAAEADGALWNVKAEMCFRAFRHETTSSGDEHWHGHPIPWTKLPKPAVSQLVDKGLLTMKEYRKAIRQNWGREYER